MSNPRSTKALSQGWDNEMTICAAVVVLAQLCASRTTETLRILVRATLAALNVVSFATVQFEAFSFLSLRQFHPSRCRLLLLLFRVGRSVHVENGFGCVLGNYLGEVVRASPFIQVLLKRQRNREYSRLITLSRQHLSYKF